MNLQIEKTKTIIEETLAQSNLPIGVLVLILKDTLSNLQKVYYNVLIQQEAKIKEGKKQNQD